MFVYLFVLSYVETTADSGAKKIVKRSASPQFENFREEDVEITGEVTGRAPIPEVLVGVRQNSK